jgi:galactokinase
VENERIANVIDQYRRRYSGEPRVFRAPGRVNLIGEHTDYNDGFVMPFAIDRETLTAGSSRPDRLINAAALDMDGTATIDLDAPAKKLRGTWVDYVEGTARSLAARVGLRTGADIVFSSDVPIGSGLSSSAALETSIGFALLSLAGLDVDREKLAFAAQAAEHEYAGIRSGIMDQFTSVFGRAGHAMLLDCRSLGRRQIPIAIQGARLVVCDTGVKHELASTEYNRRREECEEGVRLLAEQIEGVRSLRDIAPADLDEYGCYLPDVIARRCRHVVGENERTLCAADALKHNDAAEVGRLMFDSHRSLRDDYEVSCPELDVLVNAASKVEGVYGARMTGGGFGGCTVNLIQDEVFAEFTAAVTAEYESQFGNKPQTYAFDAAEGASEIRF